MNLLITSSDGRKLKHSLSDFISLGSIQEMSIKLSPRLLLCIILQFTAGLRIRVLRSQPDPAFSWKRTEPDPTKITGSSFGFSVEKFDWKKNRPGSGFGWSVGSNHDPDLQLGRIQIRTCMSNTYQGPFFFCIDPGPVNPQPRSATPLPSAKQKKNLFPVQKQFGFQCRVQDPVGFETNLTFRISVI